VITVDGREHPSLAAVHAWAEKARPTAVVVDATGQTIHAGGTAWTVPCPLTIRGGLWDGSGDGGTRSPSWWLSWRTPHPLTLTGIAVRGYAMGGLDAGCSTGRTRVVVRDSRFARLGGGPGYAAVFLSDGCDAVIERCQFAHIEQAEHPEFLHAVYLIRSAARVSDCQVATCSGDPFRARDGSVLDVVRCSARRAGVQALCSTWRQPDEAPSVLTTRDCHPGRTYGGRPALTAYRVR